MWCSGLRLVVGVLSATALVGCGGSDDGVSAPAPSPVSSSPAGTPDASPQADPSPSDAAESPAAAPTAGDLGLRQRHPNGTVLQVLDVSPAATSTVVRIEAINGFTQEIELNRRGVHLVDDLGNGYNFVDPEQNAALAVPPGGTLTGTLTFLGQLDPGASTLRLLLNVYNPDDTVDVAAEYDKATAPAFQVDGIPVPG